MGLSNSDRKALYRERADRVVAALNGSALVLHKQLLHGMPLNRKLRCYCKNCNTDQEVTVKSILKGGQRECNRCSGRKAYRKTYYANRQTRLTTPGYKEYTSVRHSIGAIMGQVWDAQRRARGSRDPEDSLKERDAFLFESAEFATLWVLTELGTRPTKKHRLRRTDDTKPFMPGNVEWSVK